MPKTEMLSKLLRTNHFPSIPDNNVTAQHLKKLQLKMLRIQQGIWFQKHRAIILFEGFDACGKGGVIRRLTEAMDPRSYEVYPICAPKEEDQGKHYLYRFWNCLPAPGHITVLDRSWYGRVLVEKVDQLAPKHRIDQAYEEINGFEKILIDDGIHIIKIFLAISKKEQLLRFEKRLNDPYKQWKLTLDDIKARSKWDKYVEAVDKMLFKTHTKISPWNMIPADSKSYTRLQVLEVIQEKLGEYSRWMDNAARRKKNLTLKKALKSLGVKNL